jgi:hypothetical protein
MYIIPITEILVSVLFACNAPAVHLNTSDEDSLTGTCFGYYAVLYVETSLTC